MRFQSSLMEMKATEPEDAARVHSSEGDNIGHQHRAQ